MQGPVLHILEDEYMPFVPEKCFFQKGRKRTVTSSPAALIPPTLNVLYNEVEWEELGPQGTGVCTSGRQPSEVGTRVSCEAMKTGLNTLQ